MTKKFTAITIQEAINEGEQILVRRVSLSSNEART